MISDNTELCPTASDCPHLFREVADTLRETGFFSKALEFYKPLQEVKEYADVAYYRDMALCFKAVGSITEAEACCKALISLEPESSDPELQLADVLQDLEVSNTLDIDPEAVSPSLRQQVGKSDVSTPDQLPSEVSNPPAMLISRPPRSAIKPHVFEKRMRGQRQKQKVQILFSLTEKLIGQVRDGDAEAQSQWMVAARSLVEEFRSNKRFFSVERSTWTYHMQQPAQSTSFNHRSSRAWIQRKATKFRNTAGIAESRNLPLAFLITNFPSGR